MTVLTIPKEYRNKDLVLVPRDEYEDLIGYRQHNIRIVEEEELSPAGKRALARIGRSRAQGKLIPFRKA